MDKAITAAERGTSMWKAAEMFGVPRSTLHDHISGKVELYAKQGPKPYLTTEEEEELAFCMLIKYRIECFLRLQSLDYLKFFFFFYLVCNLLFLAGQF